MVSGYVVWVLKMLLGSCGVLLLYCVVTALIGLVVTFVYVM